LDDVRALGLLAEAEVVDPDLPELARAVVDVRERNRPALLVDEDHALAEGVLRKLGDALDDPDLAALPPLVECPVDLVVPLHGIVLPVHRGQYLALAEELPVHPRDLPGVAPEAVDVGVLAEERIGALRVRQPAHSS